MLFWIDWSGPALLAICRWWSQRLLITPVYQTRQREVVDTVLRLSCHRTGQRTRRVTSPLDQLHAAIAALWTRVFPALLAQAPP